MLFLVNVTVAFLLIVSWLFLSWCFVFSTRYCEHGSNCQLVMYRAEQNIEVIPNGSGRYRLSVHIEPENYDRLRREDVICYLRIITSSIFWKISYANIIPIANAPKPDIRATLWRRFPIDIHRDVSSPSFVGSMIIVLQPTWTIIKYWLVNSGIVRFHTRLLSNCSLPRKTLPVTLSPTPFRIALEHCHCHKLLELLQCWKVPIH